MNLQLNKKYVFITASCTGIGRTTAEMFLKEGATVIINGRSQDRLNKAVQELKEKYGKKAVYGIQGDMSCPEDIVKACTILKQQIPYLNILIGNLGTGKPISENKFNHMEWDYMLKINLLSAVSLIKNFEDFLLEDHKSSIVLLSSLAAFDKIKAPPAYAASKAGIVSLIKYSSAILAEKGIRINGVAPGNIYFAGGRWEELIKKDRRGIEQYIENEVPLKRFGTPEEIAAAIVFLASEKSSFTTGIVLQIDGGQSKGY